MSRHRLILIEGVPGSGKTTLAGDVQRLLATRGVPVRLVIEGDLNHPADYEMVAHYTAQDFEGLLTRYPEERAVLETGVEVIGDDRFIPFRLLEQRASPPLSVGLLDELARHDVYETPLPATYCRLAIDRWARFVAKAQAAPEVVILESCFLQNPLTVLLAKHNVAPEEAAEHLRRLAETVAPLDPLLIYLWQPDTRATLEHAARERPADWLNFVVGYVTRQAWGQANGVRGFDGMVAFYEMRKALELYVLPDLGIDTLDVNNTDKAAALPIVAARLKGAKP